MVSTGSLTPERVLQAAFPAPGSANAPAPELPVHIIRQGTEPRWMVLGDSRHAALVFRSWRPFKISTRLRWSAVVNASACGLLSRLPGVSSLRASIDPSYWRGAIPGFQDHWAPVLYIGNPSHTRKVTLFFVDPDQHRIRAVAKIPLQTLSSTAILNEAAVLEQLAGADFLPAAIFQDPQRGIAAQSWLEGEPVSRTLVPAHMDLLARFALPGATVRVSAQQASIARDLEEVDLPFDRDVLSRAQDFLEYDEPLPAFIEHRDFAPWNLKRLPTGRTGAIDWEWAVVGGLPCQDILRYFYIQDALFYGPGDAWQRLNAHPLVRQHLARFAIPPAALPSLAICYHLRVLAMDWRSGNTFLAGYAFRQIESLATLKPARTVQA